MIYLTEDEDRHIHDFCNQYNTTFTAQIASKLILINKSQKEEIEKKDAALMAWMEREIKLKLAFDQLESKKVESLKAIAELAVKGLKRVMTGGFEFPQTRNSFIEDTLSEIERLSHE